MTDLARLVRQATTASVGVACVLTVAKLGAALATDSVALLALLIDSVADVGGSAVTYVAVRVAQTPPDHAHRFGHGKAESLSALVQGAIVAGSALVVGLEAGRRLLRPEPPPTENLVGIAVVLLSIVLTASLLLFQRHVVRRTGSAAIRADRLHFAGDLFANAAVLASLLLATRFGFAWIDPLIGALVAALLLRGAIAIIDDAVHVLMDRELPEVDRAAIVRLVTEHPEVAGMHDLRTREAAGTRFIEFHVEIAGDMSVRAAHTITDALEAEVGALFADAEIIIHQEPAGVLDARLDDRLRSADGRLVRAGDGGAI